MTLQSAAIPYRYGSNGQVQILLVTSRKKGRWVLPKGNVRRGMSAHYSAAKEAFEEAGVLGRAAVDPIASYEREKRSKDNPAKIRVEVYPMAVVTEAPVWPEMRERKRRWTFVSEALDLIANKEIRRAIAAFDGAFKGSGIDSPADRSACVITSQRLD